MPPLWLIKAGGVLAILAGAWLHGRHIGAAGVTADWDAQKGADQRAAESIAARDRLQASMASASYQAQRAEIAGRAGSQTPEARYALHATICPAAGAFSKPLELGDVPVPAAQLDRLRRAGADPAGS